MSDHLPPPPPCAKPLPCPTCRRRPSERFGEDFAKCEYPGDGETYGPMVEYAPTGYVTAPCPDPIHDLADRVGEMREALLNARAWIDNPYCSDRDELVRMIDAALRTGETT